MLKNGLIVKATNIKAMIITITININDSTINCTNKVERENIPFFITLVLLILLEKRAVEKAIKLIQDKKSITDAIIIVV